MKRITVASCLVLGLTGSAFAEPPYTVGDYSASVLEELNRDRIVPAFRAGSTVDETLTTASIGEESARNVTRTEGAQPPLSNVSIPVENGGR